MVAVQADCSVVSNLEPETLSSVHSYTICAAKSSVFVNVDGLLLAKSFCEKVRQIACSSRAGSLPSFSMRCSSNLTSSAYRSR